MKLDLLKIICPACGQQVEAVVLDGRIKGYCAIAKKYVGFQVKKQPPTATKNEISARPAPIRAGRDSRGRFIKGNIPLNRRVQSP